ncbi:MAG TPA: hypothetical protein VIV60_12560 [Polyangiaceae bacterium]
MTSSVDLDDNDLLRLPLPPRPARVDLAGDGHPTSEVRAVARPVNTQPNEPGSLRPTYVLPQTREPSPNRPPIEVLLKRAEVLARSMTISDPRGRLLQVALVRRDHTLLDAIVRSIDTEFARQCCATWRPSPNPAPASRKATSGTRRAAMERRPTERRATTEWPVTRYGRFR